MERSCAFCQVAPNTGDQTERVIFSDQEFVAMFVSHPQTLGHFVVFPNHHFSELAQMIDKVEPLTKTTVNLAERVTLILGAKAYVLKLNNKLYALEDHPGHVGHIHMHVIPRYTSDDHILPDPLEASASVLQELASRIRISIQQ